MNLSRTDKSTIVRLLGVLQDHLESAIESSLVPKTNEPMPEDATAIAEVARDRRTWRQAEDMIKKLQAKP